MSFFVGPSSSTHSRPSHSSRSHTAPSHTYTRAAPSPHSNGSFFSTSRGGNSSSFYKRRSRDGYIHRLVTKIKKLLRDLYRYIRKNPTKVFLPVVMALVSGGALHNLARSFGVTLPEGLKHLVGIADAGKSVRGGYDAWYGSQNVGGGRGGYGHGHGHDDGLLSHAMKMASAFM